MKQLLGWMQQKLRQKGTEPFKDCMIGSRNTCFLAQSTNEDPNQDAKPSFSSGSSRKPKHESENLIFKLEAKEVEENFNNKMVSDGPELFHGFLTIGTLGSQPIKTEPPTPTFGVSVENAIEDQTEVTVCDLKFINNEIEKFLEAEAKEEKSNESSRRQSYVSVTTISEKPMEGINSEECEKMLSCPLQKYLFGSSIELAETMTEVKKEKTSLAELFRRTKTIEENSERYGEVEIPHKRTPKSVRLVKKMLKKFHASSRGPTPLSSDLGSVSTKKKFQKVIQMFHKKIYPENIIPKQDLIKTHRHKINSNSHDGGHVNRGMKQLAKGNRSFPQGPNDAGQFYKKNIELPQYELSDSTFKGKEGQWITTDADYLVLEL